MRKNFGMKKLYYSISEVSKITELEQYVLRYWETEFEQLRPAKNLAGNRIYTNKDIKLILQIKKLLREEKYTIDGAKKLLKNNLTKQETAPVSPAPKPQPPLIKATTHNELSLFNMSQEQNENTNPQNEQLKDDLKELKSFLNDLLKELD
jgi:DNA-binding transcriptional MerR regulator